MIRSLVSSSPPLVCFLVLWESFRRIGKMLPRGLFKESFTTRLDLYKDWALGELEATDLIDEVGHHHSFVTSVTFNDTKAGDIVIISWSEWAMSHLIDIPRSFVDQSNPFWSVTAGLRRCRDVAVFIETEIPDLAMIHIHSNEWEAIPTDLHMNKDTGEFEFHKDPRYDEQWLEAVSREVEHQVELFCYFLWLHEHFFQCDQLAETALERRAFRALQLYFDNALPSFGTWRHEKGAK